MNKFILLYRNHELTEVLEWLENFGVTGETAIFALSLIGQEKNAEAADLVRVGGEG